MYDDYISAALEKATFKMTGDKEKPYHGEIPCIRGMSAKGITLDDCREKLAEFLDALVFVRRRKGLAAPRIAKIEFGPTMTSRF